MAVERVLTPEEFARYFQTPPPPKIATLVELAQKARNS
jgi:hypothetical protein